MPTGQEKFENKYVQVNIRLFREDVEEAKRRAFSEGMTEWHPKLRQIVHEAMKAKKVIR